ncbi:MAG: type II toxin-antitoxin system RelE/ParE family toxin [Oscillospiraceae bacterium]|nr:type II toxin-antitoxin system RelE/ParE family toxin [Oscillospiraceae bacterium]MCR4935463.1 type II toxin-antitoxin system RelE/ParE family toxin [Oscillospiraceae bacterium]
MDSYEIVMTPDAIDDLTELRNYIADVLLAPTAALNTVRAIRKEIADLSVFPAANRTMDEEPWHSRGLRRVQAKNFFIYYRIDEAGKRVYILNIIYARRDQLNALSENSKE